MKKPHVLKVAAVLSVIMALMAATVCAGFMLFVESQP